MRQTMQRRLDEKMVGQISGNFQWANGDKIYLFIHIHVCLCICLCIYMYMCTYMRESYED